MAPQDGVQGVAEERADGAVEGEHPDTSSPRDRCALPVIRSGAPYRKVIGAWSL
jgi:hypothetical protein